MHRPGINWWHFSPEKFIECCSIHLLCYCCVTGRLGVRLENQFDYLPNHPTLIDLQLVFFLCQLHVHSFANIIRYVLLICRLMWECILLRICLLHRVDWHYYNFWFRMVTHIYYKAAYIKGNWTLWLGGKSTKTTTTTTTTRSNCNKWRHWNCIHSKWGNETLLFSVCLQIYWAWKLYANWVQAAAATAEVPKALCEKPLLFCRFSFAHCLLYTTDSKPYTSAVDGDDDADDDVDVDDDNGAPKGPRRRWARRVIAKYLVVWCGIVKCKSMMIISGVVVQQQ